MLGRFELIWQTRIKRWSHGIHPHNLELELAWRTRIREYHHCDDFVVEYLSDSVRVDSKRHRVVVSEEKIRFICVQLKIQASITTGERSWGWWRFPWQDQTLVSFLAYYCALASQSEATSISKKRSGIELHFAATRVPSCSANRMKATSRNTDHYWLHVVWVNQLIISYICFDYTKFHAKPTTSTYPKPTSYRLKIGCRRTDA